MGVVKGVIQIKRSSVDRSSKQTFFRVQFCTPFPIFVFLLYFSFFDFRFF